MKIDKLQRGENQNHNNPKDDPEVFPAYQDLFELYDYITSDKVDQSSPISAAPVEILVNNTAEGPLRKWDKRYTIPANHFIVGSSSENTHNTIKQTVFDILVNSHYNGRSVGADMMCFCSPINLRRNRLLHFYCSYTLHCSRWQDSGYCLLCLPSWCHPFGNYLTLFLPTISPPTISRMLSRSSRRRLKRLTPSTPPCLMTLLSSNSLLLASWIITAVEIARSRYTWLWR